MGCWGWDDDMKRMSDDWDHSRKFPAKIIPGNSQHSKKDDYYWWWLGSLLVITIKVRLLLGTLHKNIAQWIPWVGGSQLNSLATGSDQWALTGPAIHGITLLWPWLTKSASEKSGTILQGDYHKGNFKSCNGMVAYIDKNLKMRW